MKYLLDTCVVSETSKQRSDPLVLAWLGSSQSAGFGISVLTLAELQYGIVRLQSCQRRAKLTDWLAAWAEAVATAELPVSAAVARCWADLRVRAGRTLPTIDGLLAATALEHGLTLVTRNTRDFEGLGLDLLDPWSPV